MEHAVHLGAGHFIRVVSPTSTRTLIKKVKKAFRNAGLDDDDINLDTLGDDDDNDDEGSSDGTFSIGDTIGKSLALVKQVRTV